MDSTLVSYNCKNIKRSMECVKTLCKSADVIALQETWLLPYDINVLGDIDVNFSYTGKSAVDLTAGLLRGRPHGGVAILWRKSAFRNVTVVKCRSERIVAIKIVTGAGREMLVMCVYMPTDLTVNLPEFTQCLGEMNAIIQDNNIEVVFMLGDFNAHPNTPFCSELLDFCKDNNWICADLVKLGMSSETYTFQSEAHGCKRWLDHCVVTESAWQSVVNIKVCNDVYWSDHFPLQVNCNLDVIKAKIEINSYVFNNIVWGVRELEEIKQYHDICNNNFKDIMFPDELHECADSMCQNLQHRSVIDNLYNNIVNILSHASESSHSPTVRKPANVKCVHGWNKHVRDAHRQARLDYQVYVLAGKPADGPLFNKMCESRRVFKARLKYCQNNQDQIQMDILASQHSAKKFNKFWKGTKRLNGRTSLPVCVDGISDAKGIANSFKDYFQVRSPLLRGIDTEYGPIEKPIGFSSKDVAHIIKNMKRGKSPGHEGLSVEHLQHGGVHLYRVLAMFYTFCIRHSYLPSDLMKTVVVPIVKNMSADVSDRKNYRPISLATIIAKVFDGLLDRKLDCIVTLQDTQFGFREGLSTESAILSLKHTVDYYVNRKTPVYACFLDLSKAFDLVSYSKLWSKLRLAGVPPELVSILSYWYSKQLNMVRWGNVYSDEYSLECGVRQGGLTSPRLFNIYVNQLIEELSSMHVGCHIDDICVNNLSYADDMVLLSPSIGGLRQLLKVCEDYAVGHGLRYNESKSEFMLFKCKQTRNDILIPPLLLNGVPLSRVAQFKYLGHIVTENLSDELDIERERRALSVRGNMLAHRFARCTVPVKITMFKAFCQTFYTSGLWANFTQKAYNALRVQYNNVFRALFRLPRFCSASGMFADAGVDDFYAIMRKKVASMVRRVRGSRNSVLRMIGDRYDTVLLSRFTELHVLGYSRDR